MDKQDRQPRPSAASGRLPRGSAARRTVPPDTFRYTLANLEEETGIAGRNIRYYISQGLLPAAEGRGPSATYTQSHLLRLQAIALMRDQDLPLKAMKERLADLSDDHIRVMLNVEAAPAEDLWRRIALHPRLELHVREEAGQVDYDLLRLVELIISVVRDELSEDTDRTAP